MRCSRPAPDPGDEVHQRAAASRRKPRPGVEAWPGAPPRGGHRPAAEASLYGPRRFAAKRVVEFGELKGAQSAFLASEMFGADGYIKQDPRIIEALRKRGITDLRTVSCSALPVAYRAVPEQATQRVGFGSCSRTHGTYHSWGRSIEGLTFQVDVTATQDHVDFGHRDGAGAHERAGLRGDPRASTPQCDADLDVSAAGTGVPDRAGRHLLAELAVPHAHRSARSAWCSTWCRSWMKGAPVRCSTKPA